MTPFSLTLHADTLRLSLAGDLTIEHARALHTALLESLAPTRALHLDPAGLTRIDAAVLQVLIATARAHSTAVRLTASAVWDSALLRHGLTDPFQPA